MKLLVDKYHIKFPALFVFMMASYSLLGAVLDLIGLASTVTVIVWLISGLQSLFERVRDSCRACQPPEGQAQLLWSALLIYIAWVAAAALYYRHLFSFWDLMGTWLENRPVNRPVYALLHLYLFFLIVCGIYAWAITLVEISQNRKVFSDLLMIARFNTRKYQVIADMEAQHRSSSPDPSDPEAETPSVVGHVPITTSIPQEASSRRNGQGLDEDVTTAEARINEPEYQAILDSDGEAITLNPSSSSSNASSGIDESEYVDDDNDRYGLQGVRVREHLETKKQRHTHGFHPINQHRCIRGDDDDDPSGLLHAAPRFGSQFQNTKIHLKPLDIEQPQFPRNSCSSAHAESIPTAKRSFARVPITPTSPTAEAEDADTEKTDVEREKHDRKYRSSTPSTPKLPRAKTRTLPPHDEPRYSVSIPAATSLLSYGTDRNVDHCEENTGASNSNPAAHTPEHRACTTASRRLTSEPKPQASPASTPASHIRDSYPPLDQAGREAGPFWRSRDAGSAVSGDGKGSTIPVKGSFFMVANPIETAWAHS